MKHVSLKVKMALLLGVPIIVLSIALVTSLVMDKRMSEQLTTVLYDETFIASSNLIQADRDMYQAASELTRMFDSTDATQYEQALLSFEENVAQVKERVQIGRESLQSDSAFETVPHEQTGLTMSENFSQFEQNFAQWEEGARQLAGNVAEADAEERSALSTKRQNVEAAFDSARDNLDQIEQLVEVNAQNVMAQLENESGQRTTLVIGASAVAVFILIILGALVIRGISQAISRLLKETASVAGGDLTGDPLRVTRHDELGKLELSVEEMKKNLRKLVQSVDQSVEQVVGSAVTVSSASEETAASIEEVARSINDMAQGAAQGAIDAEITNEKTQAVSARIEAVHQYTKEMLAKSKEAVAASENGMNQVHELRGTATESNLVLSEAAKVMSELNRKVKNIETVVEVITGIAAQTNLLALNASIEAARAGEHGKGFAVVAEEVRKLAEESAAATGRIRGTIQSILVESNNAAAAMESTGAIAERQEAVTSDTEKVFETITNSVAVILSSIDQISSGMQEMSSLQEEASEAIESMTAITEQTAAATEEVAASADEQAKAIDSVAKSADSLQELSGELKSLISRFTY